MYRHFWQRRSALVFTFSALASLVTPLLMGQDATSTTAAPAAPASLSAGDTAWMLVSTALVLFMTIPGLALFYGGLVKTKNVLSVLMQCLGLTALLSILWMLAGYTFSFDTTGMQDQVVNFHSFIGGGGSLGLRGLNGNTLHGTIPEALFIAYQMTFAVITPALIIGAFAERMRFPAVMLFSSIWLFLVYVPVCHMTWAGPGGLFANWGVKDFAGGIVVHITAGIAALVACIMIGPRTGYPTSMEPPHNMTMTVMGTAMLWVGWFGFNAGSALGANGQAAMTLLVTHLSACSATLVWMAIEWVKLGKPGVLGAATGSVAGLAAITPASGFVGPWGAIVIGACSAAACFVVSTKVKRTFRYDDSLDVFGVHGVGGIVGTVLVAVFASSRFGGTEAELSISKQLGAQVGAAVITAVYTAAATAVALLITKMVIPLRVSGQAEYEGLDLNEHEERGYNLL